MKLELQFELQDEPKQVFEKFVEADKDGHLFKKLPNVKGFKQIELKKLSGGKFYFKNFAEGKAPIPAVVQHFIFPDMMVWEFYGERDHKKRTIDWKIRSPYFEKTVKANGLWEFKSAKKNGHSIMHLTLHLKCTIPIFGGLLEGIIASHVKQNLSDYIDLLKDEIYNHKKGKLLPL